VASFPLLKTGAVAQYGSDRTSRFSTQVYRFLDGREQRYPTFAGALHRWVVRLDLLDEAELTAMADLFISAGGRAGTFSFTDPFDGKVYAACRFDAEEIALAFEDAGRGQNVMTITEVRG
jgi:phage-related protein